MLGALVDRHAVSLFIRRLRQGGTGARGGIFCAGRADGCGFSLGAVRIGDTYDDAGSGVKYCEYDGADFCCAFPDAGDKKTDAEAHNDKNSCVNSDACPYTDTAEDARARIVRSGYHK